MLIIEGPDLVGKTTLAKKMLNLLNSAAKMPHIYAHFSKLPDGWDYFWNYLERASRNIVQDRFHFSEIVYSFVCRYHKGQSPLTPERYRVVDGILRQLGSMTVVITADDDWLKKQLDDKHRRGEMFSEEQILKVNQTFKYLVNKDGNAYDESYAWLNDYSPDWDFVYEVNDDTYAADSADFCAKVLEAYLNRLDLLEMLTEKKQPWMSIGI